MNFAFSIVLLFTLLDCVTNESSLALKGCHVPLTAFYQPVKALYINLVPLMPDEDTTFSGALVLDLRI